MISSNMIGPFGGDVSFPTMDGQNLDEKMNTSGYLELLSGLNCTENRMSLRPLLTVDEKVLQQPLSPALFQ